MFGARHMRPWCYPHVIYPFSMWLILSPFVFALSCLAAVPLCDWLKGRKGSSNWGLCCLKVFVHEAGEQDNCSCWKAVYEHIIKDSWWYFGLCIRHNASELSWNTKTFMLLIINYSVTCHILLLKNPNCQKMDIKKLWDDMPTTINCICQNYKHTPAVHYVCISPAVWVSIISLPPCGIYTLSVNACRK